MKRWKQRMQAGTILSFTRVQHAPARFGSRPRTIGLVLLEDGTHVMAPLLIENPKIGQSVAPRMRLQTITNEQLRVYDMSYEAAAAVPAVKIPEWEFRGYILALSGPSGVGKTTLSRLIVSMLGQELENVPILTTRGKKAGDDGEYRYIDKAEFEKLWKNGKLASTTHLKSSSEERWYGYSSTDIEAIWAQGKIPVVITEMHLLQGLADHFGRRSILSFGLLPPGQSKRTMLSTLLHRLRARGRDTEEQIKERLLHAKRDLQFFEERADLFDKIFVNDKAENFIDLLRENVPGLE